MTMREEPPLAPSYSSQSRNCLDFKPPVSDAGMCLEGMPGQAPSPLTGASHAYAPEARRADDGISPFALRGRGGLDNGSDMGINMHLRRTHTLAHSATSMSTSGSSSSTSSSSTFASKSSIPDTNYTFAGSPQLHRPSLPSIAAITNPTAAPSMTVSSSSPRWRHHFQGSPQMKRLAPSQTLPPLLPLPSGAEPQGRRTSVISEAPPVPRLHQERSFSSTSPLLRPLRLPLPNVSGYSDAPQAITGTFGRDGAIVSRMAAHEVDSRRSSSAYDDDEEMATAESPGYSSTSSRLMYADEDTPQPFNSRKRMKTWSPTSEMHTPTTTTSGWTATKMEATEEEDEDDMKDDESSSKAERRSVSEASTTMERAISKLQPPLSLMTGINPDNFYRWLPLWNSGATSSGDRTLQEDHTEAKGMTPLHIAIGTGKVGIVKFLVSSGANLTSTTSKGENPLHFAAAVKESAVLEYLLSLSTNAQYSAQLVEALVQRDYLGRTPFLVATRMGTLRSVQALQEAGSVTTTASHGKLNAVSHAVRGNNVEVLRYLIGDNEAGSTPKPKLSLGTQWFSYTPLQDACANGHFEIAELLLRKGADANIGAGEPYDTPLLSAVRRCDLAMVKLLLKYRANVNKFGVFEEAPLHAAARTGDSTIIDVLVEKGASWRKTDGNGDTALHIAASYGFRDCVSALLIACEGSSDEVNRKNSKGWTPLHAAADIGNMTLSELLFAAGGNPNAADKQGLTPLHLALQHAKDGNLELVRTLLSKTDLSATRATFRGETVLHLAAASGNADITRMLLKMIKTSAGIIDINGKTHQGLTALHVAVEKQNVGIVSELLAAGCDATLKNNDGQTALHIAVATENIETITMLINEGKADLNVPIGRATDAVNVSPKLQSSGPFTIITGNNTSNTVNCSSAPSPPSSVSGTTAANGKPKSYKCPHCNILIKPPKMNLQRHIAQLHREKVRFACPYPGCNVTTSRQDNWKMHLRRHEEKRKKEKERYKEMQRTAAEKAGRGDKVKQEKNLKGEDEEMKH